jgi:hypothetical protein
MVSRPQVRDRDAILDVIARSRYLFVTWDGTIPAPA